MTLEEAATHEKRNTLLRAVGPEVDVEIDRRLLVVEPGTTSTCSPATASTASSPTPPSPTSCARSLISTARCPAVDLELSLDEGGPDNITVVLVRVG